jgi:hypothetical protein
MKKVLTLIVMAVAFAMPSKAQVSFGVKGGLNFTNMSINKSNLEDLFKNKAGFFAGVTVKVGLPLVPGLAFDGAALYDQREGDIEVYTGFSDNDKSTEKLKSQSIQIPINLRYEIGLGESANIFIFAGPQVGFNIGDKTKDLWSDMAEWRLKTSNFSANVGLGFTIMSHLQVSANYNIALGTTGEVDFKSAVDKTWDTVKGDAKANSWQIALAYYF